MMTLCIVRCSWCALFVLCVVRRLVKAPHPHHSVQTTSLTEVPSKSDIKIKLGGNDVKFATGKPVVIKDSTSSFQQAEYLVYSPAQVRLRYLVLIGKKEMPKKGNGNGKGKGKGKGRAASAAPAGAGAGAGGSTQPFLQGWFWAGDSDPTGDPGAQDVQVQYGSAVEARIEAAYLSGDASMTVDSERFVDFGNMLQCRIDDPSKCRTIFRI